MAKNSSGKSNPVVGHVKLGKKPLPPWLVPGNPGHKGGPGRPKNHIKQTAAALFDELGLQFLREVIEDRYAKNGDKIKAAELLARLGVGFMPTDDDLEDVSELPSIQMVAEATPPDVPEIDSFLPEEE